MANKVAAIPCSTYESCAVRQAVDQSFAALGGVQQYVRPGCRVLLKVNLVMKKRPEEAATTHPAVVAALASALTEAGAHVTIADSPGGLYTKQALHLVYHGCGIDLAAKQAGAALNEDVSFEEVAYPEGKVGKRFPIISPIVQADLVISVGKLKTHGMTTMTGAVKNMFGAIPGTYKAEYHFRLPSRDEFCDMLVDLCQCTAPRLAFLDAVIGMEGSGPTAGEPRKIGLLLASESPYALDLVGTTLLSIPPKEAGTVNASIKRGLCPSRVEELEIVGCHLKDYVVSDFKRSQADSIHFDHSPFVRWLGETFLKPRPGFDEARCVGCGECSRLCPPKAIRMEDKRPKVDLSKCIRCFCCQELCPQKAVEIKRNPVMSLFYRFLK